MQINTRITPRWVSPEQANGARFRIRPMTGVDRLELAMQIERGEDGTARYPAAAMVNAIRACLLEWDVQDEDGEVAAITAGNISRLDEDGLVILELFNEIQTDGSLSSKDDEPGN